MPPSALTGLCCPRDGARKGPQAPRPAAHARVQSLARLLRAPSARSTGRATPQGQHLTAATRYAMAFPPLTTGAPWEAAASPHGPQTEGQDENRADPIPQLLPNKMTSGAAIWAH